MCIVCKGIVELHGGSISVTSEGLGKGSCFCIDLPIASADVGASSIANGSSTQDPHLFPNEPTDSLPPKTCFEASCFACLLGFILRLTSSPGDVVEVSPGDAFCDVLHHESEPNPSIELKRNLSLISSNGEEGIMVENSHHDNNYINMENNIDNTIPYLSALRSAVNENVDDVVRPVNSLKKSRVLIVDDTTMNRKMLKRLFSQRFEECDEAGDGQQAVDMVKKAIASGTNYDIITLDYQMPVMDGVTAANQIRKLGYEGQIIGVTGNAMFEDVSSFLLNGANIVLSKPLSISTFDEYLNTLF